MNGAWRTRTLDSLADVPEALAAPFGTDLFSTRTWLANLQSHGLDRDHRIAPVLVESMDGQRSFCVPLMVSPHGHAAVFGPVLHGVSNFYSSLFGPMGAEATCTVEACQALIRHLRRNRLASNVIDLHPLASDGVFLTAMRSALRRQGYWTDTYFNFGNWYLEVAGRPFDVYYETVPSRIRNTIRRGRKKLDGAGDWVIRVNDTPGADLEAGIRQFDAVYRKSWKVPEPFPEFIPNMCRALASEGWLRLGVLEVAGEPAAAQIWVIKDGCALIYKLAYDEEHKRFSAGSVLTAELMRRALDEERVHTVDYLTGDDSYKSDWMSHRRERVGLLAFSPSSVQGLASAARHFGGAWIARRRKSRQVAAGSAPANSAVEQGQEA